MRTTIKVWALPVVLGFMALGTSSTGSALGSGGGCPTPVQGDMDGDGDCDYDDITLFSIAKDKGDLSADWDFDCKITENDCYRMVDMYLTGGSSILDFNLDGVVNVIDLGDFYDAWLDGFNGGSTIANVSNRYAGEGDCVVNHYDLQLFIYWFNNCPWL